MRFRLLCLLLTGAALSLKAGAQATLTLPAMPLHDPWVLANAADKTYYLYTSNVPALSGAAGAGTMVYRSTDLRHWQPPVRVFDAAEGTWAKDGAWAPEVHPWHGRYYLFTTLFNEAETLPAGRNAPRRTYRRGTFVAVADAPTGPFHLLHPEAPVPPADFMTLDGTLFVERDGKPWMVYAHEWLQKQDGTMEAVPLRDDLSAAAGKPMFLFKASDAPWIDAQAVPSTAAAQYVTDGPELFRTRDGHLLMLWSSYGADDLYVQTVARSASGTLAGPWVQLPPLLGHDSGHGMLFRTFGGALMLMVHRPFKNARGKLYDVHDAGDHLELLSERTDLDGSTSEER